MTTAAANDERVEDAAKGEVADKRGENAPVVSPFEAALIASFNSITQNARCCAICDLIFSTRQPTEAPCQRRSVAR